MATCFHATSCLDELAKEVAGIGAEINIHVATDDIGE